MLNKISIITLIISITISSVSFAEEIVGGVDLDNVGWESVCTNIEPIPLKTPSISCEVSHPASTWHNYEVAEVGVSKYPNVITCEYLLEELTRLKTPSKPEGKEWSLCHLIIKQALIMRERKVDSYYYDLESWKNHVFN
jgi:hypothetical protein